ncbi:ferredoxin [Candidatus Woesearchaeota archaeon]|nr:MAG: ferredoxin [Candidatus Woesearchaeota archaeon]
MKCKIIYNRNECIGAGECEALDPDLWKVDNTGKANLSGAKELSSGVFELELSEEEFEKQKEIASSCPAGCIKVVKVE